MTRVFTTPRFRTAFDQVIEPLVLPGVLSSGEAPELTTIDCMSRGVAAIGRFVASPALLGAKVRPTGRPVRVTAHLSFDNMALSWWEEQVLAGAPLRDGSVPRLLLVRSQGKTRGAVLLIRDAPDRGVADGVVSFDLRPEELSAEGLFVLEVVSVDNGRPSWAPAAPLGSFGVLLKRIEFTEVDGDRELGLVSTGNLLTDPDSDTLPIRGGYFAVNPADGDEPRRWIVRGTLVEPPAPQIKVQPAPEPEPQPVPVPGLARILKRRAKRAARWVVPVAAVPAARRTSKRAAALKRRVLRAAKGRPSTPPVAPPPVPVVPTGPPPNRLVEAMADLVSRNVVQVEVVGAEPGPTPSVQVRALADAELEIVVDGPLTVPVLIRLSVDPSGLQEALGTVGATVRWDLVVRAES